MTDDDAWVDREYVGVDFRDDDLSRVRTERVVFTECDFSGVDMSESEHLGSAFRNCTFRRTALFHSVFRHCSLLGSVFTECRLRPVTMVEVDLTLAVLGGCDLRGIALSDCRLREAGLVGADLRKAVLRGGRPASCPHAERAIRRSGSPWGTGRSDVLDHRSGARGEDRRGPGTVLCGRARPRHPRRVMFASSARARGRPTSAPKSARGS